MSSHPKTTTAQRMTNRAAEMKAQRASELAKAAERAAAQTKLDQSEADKRGLTIDQYRLQSAFGSHLKESDFLVELTGEGCDDIALDDYECDVDASQLVFFMKNGDQYVVDLRVCKVPEEARRSRKRAREDEEEGHDDEGEEEYDPSKLLLL